MVTAKELKDEYDKKLKELQETCKHPKVSDWMEYEWSPCHYSGYQVKQCEICWKIVAKKTYCVACNKAIIYKEDETLIACDQHLCKECSKKGKYYCFSHKQFYDNPRGCTECIKFLDDVELSEMEECENLL